MSTPIRSRNLEIGTNSLSRRSHAIPKLVSVGGGWEVHVPPREYEND